MFEIIVVSAISNTRSEGSARRGGELALDQGGELEVGERLGGEVDRERQARPAEALRGGHPHRFGDDPAVDLLPHPEADRDVEELAGGDERAVVVARRSSNS